MGFQELTPFYFDALTENLFWYGAFAFPFFAVFWLVWKKYFKPIRIQEQQRATRHHFVHDLGFSFTTFFIFAALDLSLLYLESKGHTMLYTQTSEYAWWWLPVSFALVLFIDDTFFYWSHRAMHHPRLYRFFHSVHHKSTDPSPLTAFAFHPSEAVIENMMHFVLPFVFPLHIGVMIAWQVFSMLNNVLAHLGYELYPKGWVKMPVLQYKTASVHHNMHHQLFNGNYALYFTWWDKWMGTEFKDYAHRHEQIFARKDIKKTNNGLYLLTVSGIRKEANDAFTIEFENVPDVFRDFSAGQHLTIKVNIQGEILYRTFSISSVPNTDRCLNLTIKKIKGGKVTNYLAQNLQIGDALEVTSPSGQFFINPDPAHQKHYVMIAGGSGITPIYSMTGTVLHFEPKSKITLLYANRSYESIIFREKLEKWADAFPGQFSLIHYLSDVENTQPAINGHITRVSLERLLSQHSKKSLEFYLCGPETMTNKLVHDLTYLGVEKSKIHRELFLVTEQNKSSAAVKAVVHANVFGKAHQFETQEGKSILQSALNHEVPLPFSCQSGLCGICKMMCTEGAVSMQNNQALSAQELKSGYILTCQSFPNTKKISIKTP